MKDKRVFGMPVIAVVMAIVSIVTMQEGDPPIVTLVHMLFAGVCIVMGLMGLSFALGWNEDRNPPPVTRPAAAAAVTATSDPRSQPADDHLHSTLGTSVIDGGVDSGGDVGDHHSAGGDAGGGDSGGYDSGGGGGSN